MELMSKKGFTTFSLHERGFTLIELLIVISIIAVLMAIGIITYGKFLKDGRDTKRQTDLRLIQAALEKYHTDLIIYPLSLGSNGKITSDFTDSFKSSKGVVYLSTFPHDPDPGKSYFYRAYTSSKGADGKYSTECLFASLCTRYCLYAGLESFSPSSANVCPEQPPYNFAVTSPD